jgi:glutamine amidotransferase
MGWNLINYTQAHPLFNGIPSGSTFYFVHSYFAPITPWTLATCEYIREFSAVVERDNYLGVQFHPEKSGATGAQLLHNFHEIVRSHSCK